MILLKHILNVKYEDFTMLGSKRFLILYKQSKKDTQKHILRNIIVKLSIIIVVLEIDEEMLFI